MFQEPGPCRPIGGTRKGRADEGIHFLGTVATTERGAPNIDAVYLPPAAQGDILLLLPRNPEVIGIVDGVFESQPAIWHNEILFALSRGVRVAGAASMGALRAAELNDFGMKGIGAIYHAYARGYLEDDDEVAVLHSPEALNWTPLTEAKVNIRATLCSARFHGLITEHDEDQLIRVLKLIHYKELTISSFEQRVRSIFRDSTPFFVDPGQRGQPEGQRRDRALGLDWERCCILKSTNFLSMPLNQHQSGRQRLPRPTL